MIHKCKRCLYETDQKVNMRTHLSRKNPCLVVEGGEDIDQKTLYDELGGLKTRKYNVTCEGCGNKYSCRASLSRHRKTCHILGGLTMEERLEKTIERKIQQALQNMHSTQQLQSQPSGNVHVEGNMINNNNNQQYNIINIHAHGNENISYLTPDFITQCVRAAGGDGLPKFIENIHMHPDHPENHNIRGKSIRQNLLEVYDGQRWTVNPACGILDALMQKGCKVFYNHLMRNMREDEDVQSVIERQLTDLTDVTKKRKSETYYKIRRNLFFMFFQDQPDNLVVVMEPEGQDIVENTLNQLLAEEQAQQT